MGQELHQQKMVGQEAATLDELFVEFNKLVSRYAYLPLHSLSYKLAKRCENFSHVWLALSMLNTRGANGVALHDSVLRGVQIFYSDSGGKPAYQRNDLMPISPVVAEVWLSQKARGVGKEPVIGLVSLALAVLAAQKFLMGFGWTLKPIVPEAFYPLSVAQEQALGNILTAVFDTLAIPVVPFSIKEERKF